MLSGSGHVRSTVDVDSVTASDPERPRRRRPRDRNRGQCTSGRRCGDDGSVHANAEARGVPLATAQAQL